MIKRAIPIWQGSNLRPDPVHVAAGIVWRQFPPILASPFLHQDSSIGKQQRVGGASAINNIQKSRLVRERLPPRRC